MSAVPLQEPIRRKRQTKVHTPSRKRTVTAPTKRKAVGVPAKSKSRTKTKVLAPTIALHLLAFSLVFVVTYGVSVLTGYSMMEHARREKFRSISSATSARDDIGRLRRSVESNISAVNLDRWAKANGFVAPHATLTQGENID